MKRRIAIFIFFAASSGCGGDFPRDAEGTLDRVRTQRAFAVGVVAPAGTSPMTEVDELIRRVAQASGASPRLLRGEAEPLLKQLEDGHVDLVIGRFDKKSPWARRVTLGPPLRIEKQGKTIFHLAPVMRNGENGWIALVERAARDTAPGLE